MKMTNTIRLPRMRKQNIDLLAVVSLILICVMIFSVVQPAFTSGSGSNCDKERKELEKANKELKKANEKVKQTKWDLDFAEGLLAEAEQNGGFPEQLVAVIAVWWAKRAHKKAKAKQAKAKQRVEKAKKALEECEGKHAGGGCVSGGCNV